MTIVNNSDVIEKLDELQNRYISALDSKNMQAWSECFSSRADAAYICRSAENEAMNYPIALMYDDCRARIEDRITFVDDIWRGTFQDYRTRHFTQRISHSRVADSIFEVKSNFSIEYTLDPSASTPLATGVYEDVVVIEDDIARFLSKRAVYDTTVLPQYIVYPF